MASRLTDNHRLSRVILEWWLELSCWAVQVESADGGWWWGSATLTHGRRRRPSGVRQEMKTATLSWFRQTCRLRPAGSSLRCDSPRGRRQLMISLMRGSWTGQPFWPGQVQFCKSLIFFFPTGIKKPAWVGRLFKVKIWIRFSLRDWHLFVIIKI